MRKRGFTLLETVLYVAILIILAPLIGNLTSFSVNFRGRAQNISDVNEGGVRALRIIGQTVRNGKKILYPKKGNVSSTLIIRNVKNKQDKTKFALVEGRIIMTTPTTTAAITSERITVDNLTFQHLFGKSRQSVKTQFTVGVGDFQKTFYGAATIRRN